MKLFRANTEEVAALAPVTALCAMIWFDLYLPVGYITKKLD